MVGIDKIGKSTGPGDGSQLVTDQDIPSSVIFEFIIFNYNIDGNLLKPEHKALLNEHVVPFLRTNRFHAELTGTTSRTGTANYDHQLSLERVHRVREFLLKQGLTNAQVPVSDVKAVGKDLSTSKSQEDELDRSVRIRIVVGVRPIPVLPNIIVPTIIPPNGPTPPASPNVLPEVIIIGDTTTPWAIQELTGVNVGLSFGAGAFGFGASVQAGSVEYHFLLVNLRTRQMAQCRYFGGALGAGVGPAGLKPGVGPGGGMSMTQGSHTWDSFKTTKSGATFNDFSGTASWIEPAGLGLGSDISVKALLKFFSLGITVRVSTGNTIGTPGSLASIGNFFLKPPVQLQL